MKELQLSKEFLEAIENYVRVKDVLEDFNMDKSTEDNDRNKLIYIYATYNNFNEIEEAFMKEVERLGGKFNFSN